MVKKCCVYGCSTNYSSEKIKRKKETNQLGAGESKPKYLYIDFQKVMRSERVIPNANLKVTNDTDL